MEGVFLRVGEHILPVICGSQVEEHISLEIVPGGENTFH